MEPKMQTEQVMLKKEKLSVSVEQIVENDMSLADYYGDIVKVLGNSVSVNIFSAAVTGDKAVIDGCVRVRTLYINNENMPEIFETDCPFNRSVDVRDASDSDCVSVSVASERVSCRAVNQRRAEIRGSVSLRVSVWGMSEQEVFSAENNDFCHILPMKTEGFFPVAGTVKCWTVSSSFDVAEGVKAKKIYRVSTLPTVSEVRTIKNKMMVKGFVTAEAVLLTDEGSFVTQKMNLPVNQIADMDGIDEESRVCVSMNVRSCDVNLTADTPQSPPKLEVSLIVAANIDAYRKRELCAVSDAYSHSCELICRKNNIKCVTDIIRVNETFTVNSEMDFSSCKAVGVADAAVRLIRYTVQPQGNTLVLKGNIHFGIVVITEENERLYFDRIADFEYTKQFGTDVTDCDFQPTASVNTIIVTNSPNSRINLATELYFDGYLNITRENNVITSIEKGSEIEKKCDDGEIFVYFATKGERLWDIAASHRSSVELIKNMNGTDEDVLGDDRILIFEAE